MINLSDFIIKETPRKIPRYTGEVNKQKLYKCFCSKCEVDKGYIAGKKDVLCKACSSKSSEKVKENIIKNHWSKTGTYKPPKIYITELDLLLKKQKELKNNRKYYIEYYQNNKQSIHNKRTIYKNNNINFKIAAALRTRLNHAINDQKVGSAVNDLGCSISKLKIYLQLKFIRNPRKLKQTMNWDNWTRDGWHIDHIKPLSSFNLTNPEELKKACHYSNLQPLWAKDNLKKGNKLLSDTIVEITQ